MKIVIAPDSFKGSATSYDIAQWLGDGIRSVLPESDIVKIEIGDGGEGSLQSVSHVGFELIKTKVVGPSGNLVDAVFGIKGETAFIELAEASGLSKLLNNRKMALTATSYGTGQLISAALDRKVKEIYLAVGGSACTDAGAGALQALGGKLLDSAGNEISRGGIALLDCTSIDITDLDPRIKDVTVILASDVTNPLTGPYGAAHVFAAQKGASPEDIYLLEEALQRFAKVAQSDKDAHAGAGSAGGFGFMAMRFLGATMQSGAETILRLVGFERLLEGADLVITGEGKFDTQSLKGKAPITVAEIASRHGVPVVLVCGENLLENEGSHDAIFKSIHTLVSVEPSREKCINNPQPIVEKIGASIAISLRK